MKNIVYIKGSSISDVRLQKFLHYFVDNSNYQLSFWGWSRDGRIAQMAGVDSQYLLTGGGFGKKAKLFFYYIIWTIKVFFKCLRTNLHDQIIIAIDFDSALPVYWASRLKKFTYLYEVYDDFALRYKFPSFIRNQIHKIDTRIMKNSKCVIHVDTNRVSFKDCNWIVIENTPADYFGGCERKYDNLEKKFAVIGYFSRQRGIGAIHDFAEKNLDLKFLVVGRFIEQEDKDAFVKLQNVEYHDFMPQDELYSMMTQCCAVFSLYDPSVEINRLAASNKVYDAMMFGIPVITNKEVINSDFIKKNNIGFVVNYLYDKSWDCLIEDSFMKNVEIMGSNGRSLYLKKYQFSELVRQRLIPVLESI